MNSLADILDRVPASAHEEVAVIDGDRSWTWVELDRGARRVARSLARDGVAAQERVGLLARNCGEFYEALFGAGLRNAVLAPVNWRLSPREIAAVIDDEGCRVLFVEAALWDGVRRFASEFEDVERIVIFDGPGARRPETGEIGYADWLAPDGPAEPVPCAPDDVALQIYTSGTTGLPKGVMNTHANLEAAYRRGAAVWDFDTRSVNLIALPQFHNSGTMWSLIGMAVGALTVVLREPHPLVILDAIERHGVTNVLLVPAVIQRILDHPRAPVADLSSLRNITYGGSPTSPALLRRCHALVGSRLIQSYALSETSGQLAILSADQHDAEHEAAAGWPSEGTDVRIVDPESEADVAPGEPGEIWARSATVMKGYWNRREATAAALTPDGWFRTGDIGSADAAGCLYLLDRVSDMIVTGGENVYPSEVEHVLETHPQVREAAVIGVPDDCWGESVKAIVVPRGDRLDVGELVGWLRDRIAAYKCPKTVEVVDGELPRNPTGKLLRRALREPYWCGHERRIG